MKVDVVCFGAMRDFLPREANGNRVTLDIPEGSSVKTAMSELAIPPRLLHSALVDGERSDAATILHDGAEVTLMPPFAGGIRQGS